jgi:hypothetical protein
MKQTAIFASAVGAIALGLSGCARGPAFNEGALGRAEFGFPSCGCAVADRGIAAGGASTSITVKLTAASDPTVRVASAVARDASIVSIGAIDNNSEAGSWNVHVKSGSPGSTTLKVLDQNGVEIDHAALTVSPTAEIGIDQGWDGEVLEVLTGQSFAVHATTWGSKHEDLTGVGAIQFSYKGVTQQASPPETFADQEQFRASAAGDGAVIMTAISATKELDVHAIDPSTVDKVELETSDVTIASSGSMLLKYRLFAAGTPVYGSLCAWAIADPTIARVHEDAVNIGAAPSAAFAVEGLAQGTTQATCTVNGNRSSITIRVSM